MPASEMGSKRAFNTNDGGTRLRCSRPAVARRRFESFVGTFVVIVLAAFGAMTSMEAQGMARHTSLRTTAVTPSFAVRKGVRVIPVYRTNLDDQSATAGNG